MSTVKRATELKALMKEIDAAPLAVSALAYVTKLKYESDRELYDKYTSEGKTLDDALAEYRRAVPSADQYELDDFAASWHTFEKWDAEGEKQ